MYLLVIYEKYSDGTATRKTIKDYNSYNEALAIFHNELYKAINATNVDHLLVSIIDENGMSLKRETFTASAPERSVEEEMPV